MEFKAIKKLRKDIYEKKESKKESTMIGEVEHMGAGSDEDSEIIVTPEMLEAEGVDVDGEA